MTAKKGHFLSVCSADGPVVNKECRATIRWAQHLRWVFNINIETCRKSGGAVKVIARIEGFGWLGGSDWPEHVGSKGGSGQGRQNLVRLRGDNGHDAIWNGWLIHPALTLEFWERGVYSSYTLAIMFVNFVF